MPESTKNTFLYFGFGSNLLEKRILLQNKTAVRRGFGILRDFALDFYYVSKRWQGAAATIVPRKNDVVMGAIWELGIENMEDLDRQESVKEGVYVPIQVIVEHDNGEMVECRAYHLKEQPEQLPHGVDVPYERQPSLSYLKTIVKGAIESGLPSVYIDHLKSFKNNENIVEHFEEELSLFDFTL